MAHGADREKVEVTMDVDMKPGKGYDDKLVGMSYWMSFWTEKSIR